MIVAKTFKSDIMMTEWLSDSKNLENLKKKYPPNMYGAVLNLIDKQVEIYEYKLDNISGFNEHTILKEVNDFILGFENKYPQIQEYGIHLTTLPLDMPISEDGGRKLMTVKKFFNALKEFI